MRNSFTRLVGELLDRNSESFTYALSRQVHEAVAPNAVVEVDAYSFRPLDYAKAGHCAIFPHEATHMVVDWGWCSHRHRAEPSPEFGLLEILWRGERLWLLLAKRDGTHREILIARTENLCLDFMTAVCRWYDAADGTVLVLSKGAFCRSEELAKSVQASSIDDLVMSATLRNRIEADLLSFVASRDRYRQVGLPWKRGVLLLGPPGNGKTQTIRAVLNKMGLPVIFVQSFEPNYHATVTDTITLLFRQARASSPCVIVLEDIDSLVPAKHLSLFLNEMDGLASNDGILTLATTNHPDKLDPALLERPSRFDRKLTFDLPERPERHRYLELLNQKWPEEVRATPGGLKAAAKQTKGFSFAYLKEVGISTMSAYFTADATGPMDPFLLGSISSLRREMARPVAAVKAESDSSD